MNLAKYILLKSNLKLTNPKTKKSLLALERFEQQDIANVYNKIRISFPTLTEGLNLRNIFFKGRLSQVVLVGFEEISRYGYMIISAPIGNKRWFKSQSVAYSLSPANQHLPMGAQILSYCPDDVVIEKDLTTSRVRLRGQNCGPTGFGQWRRIARE